MSGVHAHGSGAGRDVRAGDRANGTLGPVDEADEAALDIEGQHVATERDVCDFHCGKLPVE